jgi:hypothetical protein
MTELLSMMFVGTAASVLSLILLRIGLLRYDFRAEALTVRSFGVIPLRKIPYAGLTVEATGKASERLLELRARYPERRVMNLTRWKIHSRRVYGFVTDTECIYVLPIRVTNALRDPLPRAQWSIAKNERMERIASKIHGISKRLPPWLRFIKIGPRLSIAALLIISTAHLGVVLHALYLQDQLCVQHSLSARDRWEVFLGPAKWMIPMPLAILLQTAWIGFTSIGRKRQSLLFPGILLVTVCGSFFIPSPYLHDLSHIVTDDCTGLGEVVGILTFLSIIFTFSLTVPPFWKRFTSRFPNPLGIAHHSSPSP